ncbi:mucin-12-like [Ochotona curzoniae]|uniref:mucin-12-like n=1 Tax=Ochotona curzoniae TaxID=130825 RepID=UPI001B3469FA|nr:mucin-12-like [Ochotona curzoniae]
MTHILSNSKHHLYALDNEHTCCINHCTEPGTTDVSSPSTLQSITPFTNAVSTPPPDTTSHSFSTTTTILSSFPTLTPPAPTIASSPTTTETALTPTTTRGATATQIPSHGTPSITSSHSHPTPNTATTAILSFSTVPPSIALTADLSHTTPAPAVHSSVGPTGSLHTQPISSAPGKTRTLHTTAESPPTPTPTSTCDNGGTWAQGHCMCLPGFSGDHCQLQQPRCQHGGSWDGLRCICPSTFYGSTCQFPMEQVDVDTVEAVVVMEVSVDQEFTQDLKDNMSKAYRDFSQAFQEQMQEIYREVQEFKGVQIRSLRNGSIVVDYLALLELPFSPQLKSQYKKVGEQLQKASQDLDTCHSGQILCFKSDSAKVHNSTPTELTPEALCRRAAAQGYEEFYFPVVDGNRLRCVTRCAAGVDGALDCHQGLCLLQRSGPTCRCFSSDTHWVWGPRCEAAVHWRALVGCLAGAALLLLLLLLLLGVLVARARRRRSSRQDRHWDQDRKWGESWDEDIVGIFSNVSLQGSRAVEEENCRVALEMVDHNVRPSSTATTETTESSQTTAISESTPVPSSPSSTATTETSESTPVPSSPSSTATTETTESSQTTAITSESTPVPSSPSSTATTETTESSQTTAITSESTPVPSSPSSTATTETTESSQTTAITSESTPVPSSPSSTATTETTESSQTTAITSESTPVPSSPSSTAITSESTPVPSSPSSTITSESTPVPSSPSSTATTETTESSQTTAITSESTPVPSSPSSTATTETTESSQTTAITSESTPVPSSPSSTATTETTESSQTTAITSESTPVPSSPSSTATTETTQTTAITSESTPVPSSPSTATTETTESSQTTAITSESTSIFSSTPGAALSTMISSSPTSAASSLAPSSTKTSASFPPALSSSPSSTPSSPPLSNASSLSPSFSSSYSTVTTTLSTSSTPGQCQSWEMWDGHECVCAPGFFGEECQSFSYSFPLEVPDVLNATVTVIVKVTHRTFTTDLSNTSSQAYKDFTKLFEEEMNKVYNFTGYNGVIVRSLSKGSIVVQHDVLLEIDYTPDYQQQFDNLEKIVRDRIMNETRTTHDNDTTCEESILCYDENATIVNGVTLDFDFQEQCTKKAAKDFSQYYYVDKVDGKLACVTRCTPGTKSQLNCNEGQCRLQRSGPRCVCSNTDTHWYWGDTCEHSTNKTLVYGIVGAVLAVLAVLVVVLVFLLGRSQRKLHRQNKYDVSQEWQKESIPGSFQNTGVWEGKNLQGDRYGRENVYSNFRPSLDNVSPNTQFHIQRPEVVKTVP